MPDVLREESVLVKTIQMYLGRLYTDSSHPISSLVRATVGSALAHDQFKSTISTIIVERLLRMTTAEQHVSTNIIISTQFVDSILCWFGHFYNCLQNCRLTFVMGGGGAWVV